MTTRRWAGALLLAVGLWGSLAQAQSVQIGTLRGDLPPDATVGALRGPVSADTGVGAFAGSFPAGPGTGGVVGLRGSTGTPIGPTRGADTTVGGLQGSVPLGSTTGALAQPAPPGSFFGAPTAADIARRNEALAEVHLMDVSHASADAALERATTIREQTLGARHPGVAEALEGQARLVERYGRDDKAAELHQRAETLRKEIERPAGPR